MAELPVNVLKQIIFGDDLDKSTDLDEQADPMAGFILRNQVQSAVKSTGGASIVLDLPVPGADDVDDDGEMWKAPRVVRYDPGALAKSSSTKFVEVLAMIRKVFASDDELMGDAVETVTRIRDEVRSEVIQRAS